MNPPTKIMKPCKLPGLRLRTPSPQVANRGWGLGSMSPSGLCRPESLFADPNQPAAEMTTDVLEPGQVGVQEPQIPVEQMMHHQGQTMHQSYGNEFRFYNDQGYGDQFEGVEQQAPIDYLARIKDVNEQLARIPPVAMQNNTQENTMGNPFYPEQTLDGVFHPDQPINQNQPMNQQINNAHAQALVQQQQLQQQAQADSDAAQASLENRAKNARGGMPTSNLPGVIYSNNPVTQQMGANLSGSPIPDPRYVDPRANDHYAQLKRDESHGRSLDSPVNQNGSVQVPSASATKQQNKRVQDALEQMNDGQLHHLDTAQQRASFNPHLKTPPGTLIHEHLRQEAGLDAIHSLGGVDGSLLKGGGTNALHQPPLVENEGAGVIRTGNLVLAGLNKMAIHGVGGLVANSPKRRATSQKRLDPSKHGAYVGADGTVRVHSKWIISRTPSRTPSEPPPPPPEPAKPYMSPHSGTCMGSHFGPNVLSRLQALRSPVTEAREAAGVPVGFHVGAGPHNNPIMKNLVLSPLVKDVSAGRIGFNPDTVSSLHDQAPLNSARKIVNNCVINGGVIPRAAKSQLKDQLQSNLLNASQQQDSSMNGAMDPINGTMNSHPALTGVHLDVDGNEIDPVTREEHIPVTRLTDTDFVYHTTVQHSLRSLHTGARVAPIPFPPAEPLPLMGSLHGGVAAPQLGNLAGAMMSLQPEQIKQSIREIMELQHSARTNQQTAVPIPAPRSPIVQKPMPNLRVPAQTFGPVSSNPGSPRPDGNMPALSHVGELGQPGAPIMLKHQTEHQAATIAARQQMVQTLADSMHPLRHFTGMEGIQQQQQAYGQYAQLPKNPLGEQDAWMHEKLQAQLQKHQQGQAQLEAQRKAAMAAQFPAQETAADGNNVAPSKLGQALGKKNQNGKKPLDLTTPRGTPQTGNRKLNPDFNNYSITSLMNPETVAPPTAVVPPTLDNTPLAFPRDPLASLQATGLNANTSLNKSMNNSMLSPRMISSAPGKNSTSKPVLLTMNLLNKDEERDETIKSLQQQNEILQIESHVKEQKNMEILEKHNQLVQEVMKLQKRLMSLENDGAAVGGAVQDGGINASNAAFLHTMPVVVPSQNTQQGPIINLSGRSETSTPAPSMDRLKPKSKRKIGRSASANGRNNRGAAISGTDGAKSRGRSATRGKTGRSASAGRGVAGVKAVASGKKTRSKSPRSTSGSKKARSKSPSSSKGSKSPTGTKKKPSKEAERDQDGNGAVTNGETVAMQEGQHQQSTVYEQGFDDPTPPLGRQEEILLNREQTDNLIAAFINSDHPHMGFVDPKTAGIIDQFTANQQANQQFGDRTDEPEFNPRASDNVLSAKRHQRGEQKTEIGASDNVLAMKKKLAMESLGKSNIQHDHSVTSPLNNSPGGVTGGAYQAGGVGSYGHIQPTNLARLLTDNGSGNTLNTTMGTTQTVSNSNMLSSNANIGPNAIDASENLSNIKRIKRMRGAQSGAKNPKRMSATSNGSSRRVSSQNSARQQIPQQNPNLTPDQIIQMFVNQYPDFPREIRKVSEDSYMFGRTQRRVVIMKTGAFVRVGAGFEPLYDYLLSLLRRSSSLMNMRRGSDYATNMQ